MTDAKIEKKFCSRKFSCYFISFKNMPKSEIEDFQVKDLSLPNPITATIFGVRVLLHVPSNIFSFLRSNIPSNFSPFSLASLTEWLPKVFVPNTFKNILNQSIIYLQNHHDCFQYSEDSFIFLSNAFPALDPETIIGTLENFDSDLYNASLHLNQKYDHIAPDVNSELIEIFNPYAAYTISNLLAFDLQFQNSFQINTKNHFEDINDFINQYDEKKQLQEDESLALALQMQMEEEQNQLEIEREQMQKSQEDEKFARTLQKRLEDEEVIERKKRHEEESLMECCCCYNQVPFIEMAQCPEGHLICRTCVEKSIEIALAEGRVRTECLCVDGCDSKISMSELERVLPQKLIQRLNETEALNAISEINISGLRTCWRCGYKVIDEDDNSPFVCPKCNEKTCKKCSKKAHPGRSCEEAELDPNRIVELRMSEAIVKQCPKCHTQFIKEEGCNHMTCPRCHTESCYLCGADITGHVSQHFKQCKQMMTVEENKNYNNQQIQNARNKAFEDLELKK